MKAAEAHPSRRLTKHPPQKLPPPSSQPGPPSPLPSPHRMPSFSKRHASFDSPREVPLPSPQSNSSTNQYSYFPSVPKSESSVLTKSRPPSLGQVVESVFTPVFEEQADEPDWTSVSKRSSSGDVAHEKGKNAILPQPPAPAPPAAAVAPPSSHIHPYPRPYSVPHAHSDHGLPGSSSPLKYKPSTAADRASSASLPLPTQIPFHALPKVQAQGGVKPALGPAPTLAEVAQALEEESESHHQASTSRPASDDGSDSTGSLPAASSSDPSRESSGRASPVDDVKSQTLRKGSTRPVSHPIPSFDPFPHLRDPPPLNHPMSLPTSPPETSLSAATALRRSATVSSHTSVYPPPEPPVILPSPPLPPPVSLSARLLQPYPPSSSSSSSTRDSFGTSDATTSTEFTSLESSESVLQSAHRRIRLPNSTDPPYAPFLSHSPPPADSWIEVETTPSEYRMNVRLPGFQRDGITLATKKRRILHVVADSWGTGGGHFERRISFGYDADLSQVRAEFDGEMLRVLVPRRVQSTIILDLGSTMGYAR